MVPDFFYINNRMTVPLEGFLRQFDNYDGFEKQLSEDLLKDALPSGKKRFGNRFG